MKVFDLFCGTGGFSKGFEKSRNAEYQTVFGVDLLPKSVETFRLNHSGALGISHDIRKIRCEDICDQLKLRRGELALIIGGPPCQGFSSIRPFRSSGEDDPRNSLFEQFANFVNWFRPRALVMENVVGLATHQHGRSIEQIEECFRGLGYECEWRILNAATFGVPQRRERLILIGVQKGAKIAFPEPTHLSDGSTIGHKNRARMLIAEDDLFQTKKLMPAVTVSDAIGDLPQIKSGETATTYDRQPSTGYQRERRNGNKLLKLHNSTAHSPKMLEIIRHSGKNINSIPQHLISSGFSSCYSRLDGDMTSVTITVNFVHPASNRCIHPYCDRALTPREGARIQSFDDDFEFAGNRSQVVKQIGNAVPPLLGRAIGEALAPIIGG
ncbi:MAG: DNA cytosine methyltransferase [Luteolibacter sp.]|jgi:DNA (cytosine-5)-methyltransferase 1|nr:DNA cytosine methyltransferase [Luteolibacter sp.]